MKQFKLAKDIFNDIAGLSCLENYLLYAFITENYQYPYLYYKSYLSLPDIIASFLHGNKYESFYTIERLQQIAAENHLIRVHRYEDSDFSHFQSHDFNCIMVRPKYIKEKYGIDLLRDDHYMLLSPMENTAEYAYINDLPRDIGVIKISELEHISAGKMFCFDILKCPDKEQKETFLIYLYNSIKLKKHTQIDFNQIDIVTARDILGIYKIVSRRLIAFCSLYMSMNFYRTHLERIEQRYMMLEYMRLLGEKDLHRARTLLEQLCMENDQYITILTCKMEEIL